MSTIQVIDNFLPNEVFVPFALECMTRPHYSCSDYATNLSDSDGSILTFGEDLPAIGKVAPEFMFQATLLRRGLGALQILDFFLDFQKTIDKIQEKLNVKKFHVIRANCTVVQPKAYEGKMHTDMKTFTPKHRIAILYLNTNNGGTKFEDGTFVQSKKNRCVIAPMDTKHAGVWQTDAKLRFVLNINYEEN